MFIWSWVCGRGKNWVDGIVMNCVLSQCGMGKVGGRRVRGKERCLSVAVGLRRPLCPNV